MGSRCAWPPLVLLAQHLPVDAGEVRHKVGPTVGNTTICIVASDVRDRLRKRPGEVGCQVLGALVFDLDVALVGA